MYRARRNHRRVGTVVVQVVVCSTVLLGFCALALDIAQLHLARTELQRSADAGALAGASVYLENAGLLQSNDLRNIAIQRAQAYAALNVTLGQPTLLDAADVVAGTLDLDNPAAPLDTSGDARFNAVRVLARRTDGSSNGAVVHNFARILGFAEGGVGASAIAAFDDRFAGYRQTTQYGPLVPFTIHRDVYADMLENGPDEYSYDSDSDIVLETADDVREVKLYPYWDNAPGNFGLLNIGTPNHGVPALEEQILYGVTAADLELEIGTSELTFYDSAGQPTTYNITGTPGLKVGLSDAVEQRIGDVIGFFLHDQVTGNGANAVYRIVDLRFGRVMTIDLHGNPNHKRLLIQPVAYTGPGVVVHHDAPSSNGQVGALRIVR
ncbi:MAG: hypothetical protein KA383_02220 [Phycisphaerae bacterium]|nr:hypothetical protein [Phycisphaerae bacterium]